jgi:hypothetical protein
MGMGASLGPQITYEDLGTGNGLKITVNDNAEEKSLRIGITISSYYSKSYTGLRACAEFFEGSKRIEDIKNIIQDKRFWNLIEYYQKKLIEPVSKEDFLLTANNILPQEPEINVKPRTNFLADVARGVFPRSAFRANRTLTADFLVAYEYVRQRLNVYTSCKTCDDKEIIVARTSIGRSTDVSTYKNLTLFNAKLPSMFFYLHLANVILANRLMLKQTRDLITGIERALYHLRRGALPYGLVIAVIHGLIAAAYFVFYSGTEVSLYNLSFEEVQQKAWALLNLFVLPLLWPITAFFLRRYASKIVSIIVRYTIGRIMNKSNLRL